MPDGRPSGLSNRSRSGPLAAVGKLTVSQSGVTAIEYAFIAGLVAIAIVAAVTTLGTTVSDLFGSVLGGF